MILTYVLIEGAPGAALGYSTISNSPVQIGLGNGKNPILVIDTEGGPDHRTNLISLQTSLICLPPKEDRDMVVPVQTPHITAGKTQQSV